MTASEFRFARWFRQTCDAHRAATAATNTEAAMVMTDSHQGVRTAGSQVFGLRRMAVVGLTVLMWQLLACAASALDLEKPSWGFNGKVALNRFNLLSVLVSNPSPQPFDGDISLINATGGGGHVDTRIVERVSLSPFAKRWVQFYPYVAGDRANAVNNENWVITYGRGNSYEVDPPRAAKYQRVMLDDSSGLGGRAGILKTMPESLFPSFVSATDALQVVGLDREPRTWIPAQKLAFVDWVHLGGLVLLFHGPTGKHPEFNGPLSVLNSPLDELRLGAGRVIKLPMRRDKFAEDEARRVLFNLPKNQFAQGQKPEDLIDTIDPLPAADPNESSYYTEGADQYASSSFLSQLKEMTKPDHNWVLLHFMFWIYIAMVFPGCYLLGKRWSDFRLVYAALLGTVLLFSCLFSVVGQRGYGEATAVHSVAIARALPDGGLDVAQWSNVFVTSGADYLIKHGGSGALYATCSGEQVNGKINNGNDGEFLVDIPPFSNREFTLRVRLPTGSPKITVEHAAINDSGDLTDLLLNVAGISPAETQSTYILYDDQFFAAHWQDGRLKLSSSAGDPTTMLRVQMQNWSGNAMRSYGYNRPEQSPQQRYSLMFAPLLSRSLNVARESDARQVRLPAGVARVYLYAGMPPEFTVQNSRLGLQAGQVLYCVDVPLPEK